MPNRRSRCPSHPCCRVPRAAHHTKNPTMQKVANLICLDTTTHRGSGTRTVPHEETEHPTSPCKGDRLSLNYAPTMSLN